MCGCTDPKQCRQLGFGSHQGLGLYRRQSMYHGMVPNPNGVISWPYKLIPEKIPIAYPRPCFGMHSPQVLACPSGTNEPTELVQDYMLQSLSLIA